MSEVFSQGGGLRLSRRFSKRSRSFSPSFGVRAGYIQDPQWPPPVLGEEAPSPRRRFLRVPSRLDVQLSNGRVLSKLQGDLSANGAMFIAGESVIDDRVTLTAADGVVRARAQVLSRRAVPNGFAHHLKLVDPAEAAQVARLVDALARQ